MLPYHDPHLAEQQRKIREKGRVLFEQRVDYIIRQTKNHPEYPLEILAAVHEEQALRRMNKHAHNIIENYDQKAAERFWINQQRFLEFIDVDKPEITKEPQNIGYLHSHAKFLMKKPMYQEQLEKHSMKELQNIRKNYWNEYNSLVQEMHNLSPKYDSLDGILIK